MANSISNGFVLIVFCVFCMDQISTNDVDVLMTRHKRIVIGNETVKLPPRPLPIGNLSSARGEADCYFFDNHFYCFSQFLTSFFESDLYCREEKMNLLYIENEEEHEYLYNFMSSNSHGSARLFLQKTDFPNEEDYSDYVFDNISPGMLVKCISICGRNVRPNVDEGRVLDYESREYIGLAIKVQWKTGRVNWYPAQNLRLGGFRSQQTASGHRPNHDILTLEETIFEPGDRVRMRNFLPNDSVGFMQGVSQGEIGIISDLDFAGGSSLVFFPSNKGWRGPLSYLEIIDKRKASGTYWTSGIFNPLGSWKWNSNNQPIVFTNWAMEESHQPANTCLEIKFHKQGKWYSANCNDRNHFICKK